MTPARVVVVGVGNRTDPLDRVGPTVADRVARLVGDDVEVVTVTDPARLIDLADGRTAMVVVDAARLPAPASGPLLLDADEVAATPSSRALGTHGLSVPDALAFGRVLGRLPRLTHVVAVPVGPATRVGAAPRPSEVDDAVDLVLRLVRDARPA